MARISHILKKFEEFHIHFTFKIFQIISPIGKLITKKQNNTTPTTRSNSLNRGEPSINLSEKKIERAKLIIKPTEVNITKSPHSQLLSGTFSCSQERYPA